MHGLQASWYGAVVRQLFCLVVFFVGMSSTPALASGLSPGALRLDFDVIGAVAHTVDVVGISVVAAGDVSAAIDRAVDGLASSPTRPRTSVSSSALSSQELLQSRAATQVPPHYAWIERDTRAFWYAAGASAVTTLGTHVLVGLPTLALGGGLVSAMLGTGNVGLVGATATALGIFLVYTAAESTVSALVAMLVFDSMSETYEGQFASAFFGHFAGAVAGTGVTTLTFGGGLILLHGMGLLAEFTGGAGLEALTVFSFLGAMPAVVIAGTALVAVPALASAWALAAGARPKDGYAIDVDWRRSNLESRTFDPARRETIVTAAMPMQISLPSP